MITDRVFASLVGKKAVSALYYGLLLASIPGGILKLGNIAITSFSEEGGSLEKLNFYMKKILIITIPIGVAFFMFSELITKLLFGYGAFSNQDIVLTAKAMRYFSLSIPFMLIWPILYRIFQIRENLKPIFFVAIIGILLNIFLNYLFVVKLKYGIMGICLGTFGAYFLMCGVSYAIIRGGIYGKYK